MTRKDSIGTICLRNAKKVFPSEVTRISPHDFMDISIRKKKFLTKSERKNFQEMADQNGLVEYSDLLIVRRGKCLEVKEL